METQTKIIKIALVDDHALVRYSLVSLINDFENCQVMMEAGNGKELVTKLQPQALPDIVLLDLCMPEMDGFETAYWLCNNYPAINILMLSMYENHLSMIRLIQSGVKGFVKKDSHPSELLTAIRLVMKTGFYYPHNVSGMMANVFRANKADSTALEKAMLATQEISFLKLAASDLTYKEIAIKMKLNPRAVDSLRNQLFEKLCVKSRVGLAMYAIRQGIVCL